MKALTIQEPYATLIAAGRKTIETRSWPPPASLIGQRIAIHAGKQLWVPMKEVGLSEVHHGMVVATARLMRAVQVFDWTCPEGVGCFAIFKQPEGGTGAIPVDPYGDFSVGRWLWMLDDVQAYGVPLPAKGRQGLWNWEEPQ